MKVLFMCLTNSTRSQMAEAWANHLFKGRMEARSAGQKLKDVHPLTVEAMKKVGIDISKAFSKNALRMPPNFHAKLEFLITIGVEDIVPVFLAKAKRLSWEISDPAEVVGTEDEKLAAFEKCRDEIRKRVEEFGRLNSFMVGAN